MFLKLSDKVEKLPLLLERIGGVRKIKAST
jgi:hypothetical protein